MEDLSVDSKGDTNKTIHKEIGWKAVDGIDLDQERDKWQGCCEYGYEPPTSI